MSTPSPSKLDAQQVLQAVVDESTGSLRVEVTAGTFELSIQSSTDNIAIGNANNDYQLLVNSDGSIDTRGVQLFTLPFDAITATYPSSTSEVYQSRVGGISGSVQQTLTLNYVDSTKAQLLNAAVV
jgi:hypothetical protein